MCMYVFCSARQSVYKQKSDIKIIFNTLVEIMNYPNYLQSWTVVRSPDAVVPLVFLFTTPHSIRI